MSSENYNSSPTSNPAPRPVSAPNSARFQSHSQFHCQLQLFLKLEALPLKAGLLWHSPDAPPLGGTVLLVDGHGPALTPAPFRERLRAFAGGAGRRTIRRAAPEPDTAGGVRGLPTAHCPVVQGQPHPRRFQRRRDRPVHPQCIRDSVSSCLSLHFLKLLSAAAGQPTAFSYWTKLGPPFLRAYYVPGNLPGAVLGPGVAAENSTHSSMPPRVSCRVGKTHCSDITQIFSCPCDWWSQQEAAEENKVG